jgi:hypothetical protein
MDNFIVFWLIFNWMLCLPFGLAILLNIDDDVFSYLYPIKEILIPIWSRFTVFGKILLALFVMLCVPMILIYYVITTIYKIGSFIFSLCIKDE